MSDERENDDGRQARGEAIEQDVGMQGDEREDEVLPALFMESVPLSTNNDIVALSALMDSSDDEDESALAAVVVGRDGAARREKRRAGRQMPYRRAPSCSTRQASRELKRQANELQLCMGLFKISK